MTVTLELDEREVRELNNAIETERECAKGLGHDDAVDVLNGLQDRLEGKR